MSLALHWNRWCIRDAWPVYSGPADILRSDAISEAREAALNARECGLIGPVGLIYMAARGASARSVVGVNRNHRHTSEASLVLDKGTKFMERPTMQYRSLAASGPYPVTDARQILDGNPAPGALRSIYDTLADLVVDVLGKATLLAGEPF